MTRNPDPTSDAQKAFKTGWAAFIASHNARRDRRHYINHYEEPATEILRNAYEKFLRAAKFPDHDTAKVNFSNFQPAETTALLIYLDKTQIYSTMEWHDDAPYLVVKDSLNPGVNNAPVKTMAEQKRQLLHSFSQAAQSPSAQPLYIPPFNVLPTQKGIYILLDHMRYNDLPRLEKALKSEGLPTHEKDSSTFGHVYVIPLDLDLIEKLKIMQARARTQENKDLAPEEAIIGKNVKGAPAINILNEDGPNPVIPLEGMFYPQITALQERLNQAFIPHTYKDTDEYGPVFAVDEANVQKLGKLRDALRTEHNQRKDATMAASMGTNREPQ